MSSTWRQRNYKAASESDIHYRVTGHVRFLSVCLDYHGTEEPLTCIVDGERLTALAEANGVSDITKLFDNGSTEKYPTRAQVMESIQEICGRCVRGDYFVFQYCGHGVRVPLARRHPEAPSTEAQAAVDTPDPNSKVPKSETPQPSGAHTKHLGGSKHHHNEQRHNYDEKHYLFEKRPAVETHPTEEVFVLRTRDGEDEEFLDDDDLARHISDSLPPGVPCLFLCDACGSGTVLRTATPKVWGHNRIVFAISGCQNTQSCGDTGNGGIMTNSLLRVLLSLDEHERKKGRHGDLSVQYIFNRMVADLKDMEKQVKRVKKAIAHGDIQVPGGLDEEDDEEDDEAADEDDGGDDVQFVTTEEMENQEAPGDDADDESEESAEESAVPQGDGEVVIVLHEAHIPKESKKEKKEQRKAQKAAHKAKHSAVLEKQQEHVLKMREEASGAGKESAKDAVEEEWEDVSESTGAASNKDESNAKPAQATAPHDKFDHHKKKDHVEKEGKDSCKAAATDPKCHKKDSKEVDKDCIVIYEDEGENAAAEGENALIDPISGERIDPGQNINLSWLGQWDPRNFPMPFV